MLLRQHERSLKIAWEKAEKRKRPPRWFWIFIRHVRLCRFLDGVVSWTGAFVFVMDLMALYVFFWFPDVLLPRDFELLVLVLANMVVVIKGYLCYIFLGSGFWNGDCLLVWYDFPRTWGSNALICCGLGNFDSCLLLSPFTEEPRRTQLCKIEAGILEVTTDVVVVVWPQLHCTKTVVAVCMSLGYLGRPLMDSNHRPTA